TEAITIVPRSRPRTPNRPTLGPHTLVVKKSQTPDDCSAGQARRTRNTNVKATIRKLAEVAAVARTRKMRSPVVGRDLIWRGTSPTASAGEKAVNVVLRLPLGATG